MIESATRQEPVTPWSRAAGLRELLIVGVATAIAFLLGYFYAIEHRQDGIDWARAFAQRAMTPAVSYACTGRFGAIRLSPEATGEDTVALGKMREFLEGIHPDYSCASFPPHVLPTSIFDGIDSANVEQPLYLTLVYALLWRWFGPHWQLVNDVVAATVAFSFLTVYLCARPFMRPIVAAAAALLFVLNPFFISFSLTPRDALKFPFAIAIAALLIGGGTAVHRPSRFLLLACGAGMLIGLGVGFRSDLTLFLFPAAVIIPLLGQIDLGPAKSGRQKLLANITLRGFALAALLLSFAIGGWMPLMNDHLFHKHSGDVGYHAMAMGLQGHARSDLFQRDTPVGGMYMFRNAYNNDLGVGVRIMENAARRHGDKAEFAQGSYWTYAREYYLNVVSLIPADLAAGAIGAFVNLMTLPHSIRYRQSLSDPVSVDHRSAPWARSYDFARENYFYQAFATPLDRIYGAATNLPVAVLFAANLVVFVAFLSLLAATFGARAAVAALILLGTVLMVFSLKFEMRHTFYIFAVPFIAWTAVACALGRWLASLATAARRATSSAGNGGTAPIAQVKSAAVTFAAMGALLLVLSAAALVALLLARNYQVETLRPLIADWLQRQTVPADVEMSEPRAGTTRIRVLSAMPLSTGGERPNDASVNPWVEMGVIAIDLGGRQCANRPISIAAVGSSNHTGDTTFLLAERFSIIPREDMEYVAFLPAFYYRHGSTITMQFAGIDIDTKDISCVTGVRLVEQFKKDDVLFDFLVPKDPANLRRQDLFQQVFIPGFGYL